MKTMTTTISFEIAGLPPAKSEAKSMLAEGHPHAPRVRALLIAAQEAMTTEDFAGFGGAQLAIEVILTTGGLQQTSDTTNYLGGIADVLEAKGHRAMHVAHLADLAGVALFDNDRQLHEVRYRQHDGDHDGYSVRLWEL
jgi:hypothetical protein